MGANVSTNFTETITNNVFKSMQKSENKINNNVSNTALALQKLQINLSGANLGPGCDVSISQNMDVDSIAILQSETEAVVNERVKIANEVQETIKNKLQQENKGLGLGINVSTNVSKTTNNKITDISSVVLNEITTSAKNYTEGTQYQDINMSNMKCVGSKITINQDMVLRAVSENIAKAVIKHVKSIDDVNKIIKAVENDTSQKNSGINIGMIFLIIGVVVIVIIAIGAYLMYKKGPDLSKMDAKDLGSLASAGIAAKSGGKLGSLKSVGDKLGNGKSDSSVSTTKSSDGKIGKKGLSLPNFSTKGLNSKGIAIFITKYKIPIIVVLSLLFVGVIVGIIVLSMKKKQNSDRLRID
jgi:hypothetical protein